MNIDALMKEIAAPTPWTFPGKEQVWHMSRSQIERLARLAAEHGREACAKACDEEAKAIRREGEGTTNAQYDWMADGAERCAETLRSNVQVEGAEHSEAPARTTGCAAGNHEERE